MKSMKVLVLDNYDSFTYNLVALLKEAGVVPDVYRNDKISLEEVDMYDKILLSPGPGIPDEAGILKPLIATYGASKSIFGVCLGLQAIGEVYGASLVCLSEVFHGVATPVKLAADEPIFRSLPEIIQAGRYHSWSVSDKDMPHSLKVTATDALGHIMALSHTLYDVRGVQFHPESVLTDGGLQMIKNWLQL
jgi:anthranilate synthase component 2